MRIQPRYYPMIIIAVFLLFVLLGALLGFSPRHRDGGRQRSGAGWSQPAQALPGAVLWLK